MCSQLLRHAEQIEDVALLIADVYRTLRLPKQHGRGTQVFQPAHALLFLDGSVMRLSFRLPAFECLAAPELDGSQAQRQPVQRHHQTGMQVNPAGGKVHRPAFGVLAHTAFADQPHRGHILALIAELGGVMHDQK